MKRLANRDFALWLLGAVIIWSAMAAFASTARGGIFRDGSRYIFNFRRPAQDSEPDQDNARPIIDDRLSKPAPTVADKVVTDLIAENKKLKADAAKPKEEQVFEAAPEPEGSKIPDWSLLAALGVGALTPVARSAIKWLP